MWSSSLTCPQSPVQLWHKGMPPFPGFHFADIMMCGKLKYMADSGAEEKTIPWGHASQSHLKYMSSLLSLMWGEILCAPLLQVHWYPSQDLILRLYWSNLILRASRKFTTSDIMIYGIHLRYASHMIAHDTITTSCDMHPISSHLIETYHWTNQ